MKAKPQFLFTMAFLSGILLLNQGNAQSKGGTKEENRCTAITMVVNTAEIDSSNIFQTTSFFDSDGNVSPPGGNHSLFLTEVDLKKCVYWQAQVQDLPNNPKDQVYVYMIKKKEEVGNKSLLRKDVYSGSRTVEGKVKKKYIAGEEDYAIYFTVIHNGVATNYLIDPKLKHRL